MAAAFGRLLGTVGVNGATSGDITVTNNVSAGEKICGLSSGLNDVVLTVTDSPNGTFGDSSNTYTVTKIRDASGATIYRWWSDCANELTSGTSKIRFTYASSQDWSSNVAIALTGAASGAPSDADDVTGQLNNWAPPNSVTTDGSIIVGGSAYRTGTADTSTAVNGTERYDTRIGNISLVLNTREIATGGTHNVSGTWSSAGGLTSLATQMVFAQAAAGEFFTKAVTVTFV